jgi:hypothetical protein
MRTVNQDAILAIAIDEIGFVIFNISVAHQRDGPLWQSCDDTRVVGLGLETEAHMC